MSYADYDNTNGEKKTGPGGAVDYELFLDCVHCGLCTSTCPTYADSGDENEGPRGRIQMMRMVADGQLGLTGRVKRHLEQCLDCRSCTTACPSGVKYGQLIEPFRLAVEEDENTIEKRFDWFREIVFLRLFPYAERMRTLMTPVRIAQRLGLFAVAERLGIMNLIPGRLGRMVSLLPTSIPFTRRLPRFLPAVGRKRARVAFFVGCVADVMFRRTHWATVRVLQQNGCDVFVPPGQGCCGAIHYHAGDSTGARSMADANLVAFELDRYDAIVVNHAGCGAMMKEYGLYWKDGLRPHREKFASMVKDVHELLDELGAVPPSGRIDAVATYHDPCHLGHAQGITDAPRKLLEKIPGLKLKPLPEAELCCGSAGTYNLNQPEIADRLSERKLDNILSTGAEIVATANAGCMLQIDREIRRRKAPVKVMHTMDLLDLAYRGERIDRR